MRFVVLLLATLPVLACSAPTVWKRPDASLVDADRDQRQCARLAARQLLAEPGWDDNQAPTGSLEEQRRSYIFDQQQNQLEFKSEQQSLVAACMQARGYQQETVPPRN